MKTIEEQAGDYAWILRRHIRDISGEKATLAYEAFLAGAKAATRWIPVEEELPTNQDTVLLCGTGDNRDVDYCTGYFHGPKSGFIDYYAHGVLDITHWLPIPPKPKE